MQRGSSRQEAAVRLIASLSRSHEYTIFTATRHAHSIDITSIAVQELKHHVLCVWLVWKGGQKSGIAATGLCSRLGVVFAPDHAHVLAATKYSQEQN